MAKQDDSAHGAHETKYLSAIRKTLREGQFNVNTVWFPEVLNAEFYNTGLKTPYAAWRAC